MDDRYSQDGLIHDAERLKELQALPLSRKIAITQSRIIEWYEHFNGNVYVSYSGGKDSTVLADLVHRIYPDVPMVYSNTGLEYLEVQKFARDKGAEFIRPDISFVDVIKTYGYPVVSKEVSLLRNANSGRRFSCYEPEILWQRHKKLRVSRVLYEK